MLSTLLLAALAYLAFALLAILGPGLALQRLARVGGDWALALPLGMAICAAAQWLSLVAGMPLMCPAILIALDLSLIRGRPNEPRTEWPRPSLRGALPAVLALVGLLATTQYPLNRRGVDGSFLFDPMGDHALHAGLAWELAQGYPPQVPAFAGARLHYHYAADLVRAAAWRWARVHPYDSIARFEVTLAGIMLILVLRAAAAQLAASRLAVGLSAWAPLATDWSFAFAALGAAADWWADVFRGNLLLSLAFDNPVVPALSLTLGSLVALARHEKEQAPGWLVLACLQAAACPAFKVFTGAHLALALACVAALSRGRARRAALVVAASSVPGLVLLTRGAAPVEVRLAPLEMVGDSLAELQLARPSGLRLAAWAVIWIVVSLGLRVMGLGAAWHALRSRSPLPTALAALALSGWPLGLVFSTSARDLDGHPLPNAAIYFVEQAGCVLWLFTAVALAGWAQRSGRARAVVLLAAATAFPATIEFVLMRRRQHPDVLPPAVVRAMDALAAASQPGEVVMQRPSARWPAVPVVLVGRRVPYERYTGYLTQFVPRDQLVRRHETVLRFLRAREATEALAIAQDLRARFVCLYGGDRVRFPTAGVLEPIHQEEGARCFRIRYPATASGAFAPEPAPLAGRPAFR